MSGLKSVKNLLVSGITGSVGSWIGRQALQNGACLTVLVREDGNNHLVDRVRNTLSVIGCEGAMDSIHVFPADISQDFCKDQLIEACGSVDAVIHCAASMNFAEDYADRNEAVNVRGTLRMLDIAEILNVPFVYLSTAYAAGCSTEIIFEESLRPTVFNNSYEKTKFQAEQAVLAWGRRTGLDVWIFRPSIVLGDFQNGRMIHFDAMYAILRFLDMISGKLNGQALRVGADPNTTKNCIPVDYLAQAVWRILCQGGPGIYHITNPNPFCLRKLEKIFKELFDIETASFVAASELQKDHLSRPEMMFKRAASVYFPYLQHEPVFDRSRTDRVLGQTLPCPVLDKSYFQRIIQYARQVKWGQSSSQPRLSAGEKAFVMSYYDAFLTEKIGRQLLPDLKRLTAQFKILVSDIDDSSRTLVIRQGILERISENGQDCECSFTVNFRTFQRITSGQMTPQEAFFRKDIDIQGDIEAGLKLATVLSAFFKKYPYVSDSIYE